MGRIKELSFAKFGETLPNKVFYFYPKKNCFYQKKAII